MAVYTLYIGPRRYMYMYIVQCKRKKRAADQRSPACTSTSHQRISVSGLWVAATRKAQDKNYAHKHYEIDF